jgi:hypothetical protein
MFSPTVRHSVLTILLVVALVGFGFYALQPVREACVLTSEPYGSTFDPSSIKASGTGGCGEERTRLMTWFKG